MPDTWAAILGELAHPRACLCAKRVQTLLEKQLLRIYVFQACLPGVSILLHRLRWRRVRRCRVTSWCIGTRLLFPLLLFFQPLLLLLLFLRP